MLYPSTYSYHTCHDGEVPPISPKRPAAKASCGSSHPRIYIHHICRSRHTNEMKFLRPGYGDRAAQSAAAGNKKRDESRIESRRRRKNTRPRSWRWPKNTGPSPFFTAVSAAHHFPSPALIPFCSVSFLAVSLRGYCTWSQNTVYVGGEGRAVKYRNSSQEVLPVCAQ